MRLFLTNVYKFWGILSICFVMNSVAVAQDDARLEFFEGGRIDGSLILRSTLLSGPGVFASIGGTTAPYAPEPFIVFGNPAALGRINNNQFVLGFSPQIELEVTDFTDPTATVNTEIDAGLDSFEKTGPIGYPEFTFQVGRAGSAVDGLAACFMVDQSKDKWFGKIPRLLDRFAFGYNKPLIINSEFVYSGLRMRIRTIDETPESELLFFSSIKMNSSLKVTSDAWALSGARQLGKFWVGVGATRTDIGIQLTSAYLSDGILSMAGNESSFGDPRSAWAEDKSNEFSGNAYGRLDGTSWGTRVGLTYQPAEWVLLGADIRLQTKVQMEGPLDFELHRFTAMRFNADEGDSKFDVNKVNPAELTRTLAKLFEMPSNMEIEIPSAFSFGVTFLVPTNPSINFTKYSGELSYKIDVIETTETSPGTFEESKFLYKRGLKADWTARMGLDISIMQISFGGTQISDVMEGYHDKDGIPIRKMEPTLLPSMSMAFDWGIRENIYLNVLLVGLPEDAIRLSLKFDL